MKTAEEKLTAIADIALYLEAATALVSSAIAKFEDLAQIIAGEEMSDAEEK